MAVPTTEGDSRAKRYDRQIRIWGAHGQDALERAHICLVNAGPTGTEALKNLVLGGIAAFTVVDGADVGVADTGNNFMVEASDVGRKRAAAVAAPLKELNENVAGSCVEEDPMALLEAQPTFFHSFTLVIATQLREDEVLRLEAATRPAGVPLLIARSYGLAGYLRISTEEHRVVESKPDSAAQDLRFHAPWPQLQALAQSIDLATLNDIDHKHVPYGLLLVKAALQWRSEHNGALPANSAERTAFKELIKSWQRSIDGVPLDEENFLEAVSNAHKMWAPPSIPSEVRTILQDDAAKHVTSSSPDFWLLAAALRAFVDEDGHASLPLEGSIPDMFATTAMYLQLQRVYRERAEQDVAAVEAHLARILQSVGRDAKSVPKADIRAFCKNARNLRVVRFKSLADEAGSSGGGVAAPGSGLRGALSGEDTAAAASLYLLLRAADRFRVSYGRWPGVGVPGEAEGDVSSHERDLPALKSLAVGLVAEAGASPSAFSISDDMTGEVCRFGGSEVHCMGAIVGGMAAQEAIKLLTHQFVPLAGTLIFNSMGLQSSSSVFNF
mmetsp:Transcript_20485/g.61666  ORF Transcript_20485/g.61666 Transcript_20485/m.61666 type:complete len:555 (-) Transcript_20485:2962-4626(-)